MTYQLNNENPEGRKRSIRGMFDAIVPTYDLLNHVLSFGTDLQWRRDLVKKTGAGRGSRVIDLCCGSGDVSRLLAGRGLETVSLDFSGEMLKLGIKKKALADAAVLGDACRLPFAAGSFAAATIAFGIRNIPDLDRFMEEVSRVLRPGGTLAILELVRPENRVVRAGYSFYLRRLLPVIGGLVSGKPAAYRYLSGTIATFVHPLVVKEMLEKHGFGSVTIFPRTLGVAAIMTCRKG